MKEPFKHILQHFQIPSDDYSVQMINTGHINHTYKVIGKEHSFLLQKVNTQIFRQPEVLMDTIYKVSKYLQKLDYNYGIIKITPTRSGQFTYKNGDSHWRLTNYFENTYSINEIQKTKQAYQAGQMFGDFINALDGMPTTSLGFSIPDFHNGTLRWEQYQRAIKKDIAKRRKEVKGLIEELEKTKDIFQMVNLLIENQQLPIRVTHNDTKINNLLWDRNTHQPVAIIDWDTIMPATILSDFGDMVRTFASSVNEEERDLNQVNLNMDIFKNMVEGFMQNVKNCITPLEKEHLMNGAIWIIYMQTIRFLTDYLNGDTYYKTSYDQQNLDRAKNQFQLLKITMRRKLEMEHYIQSI